MRLHVVTAITRPAHLAQIADSLAAAGAAAGVDLVWHWNWDLRCQNVGGQAVKNRSLDRIDDGWVWMLDDDTIAHSEVITKWREYATPECDAVIFDQVRADGRYLIASEHDARVGFIDIGQAFLRRTAIGDHRLPEHYDGDGLFLEAVLAECRVAFVNRPLTFHNRLAAA